MGGAAISAEENRPILAHFPLSHISAEVYSCLMMSRHYRGDLDVVAAAPDGEFASMALAWFDARNKVGELDPVGTPRSSQQGLGQRGHFEIITATTRPRRPLSNRKRLSVPMRNGGRIRV
jgi:hypothetical protein